jgi:fructosamine-3-kinase
MFEAEVEGLRELALASAIRVPAVIDCGIEDGTAFIALERLHFEPATRLRCTGTPRSGTAGIVTIRSV